MSKKIAVVGTGYVGLVTGVALSEIGHEVTCIDIDEAKVARMQRGESPIYEPGLDELMTKNIEAGRLKFTSKHEEGFAGKELAYIAVGTPEKADGTADLRFIEAVAKDIATHVKTDITVVTKSTVPVGTNDYVRDVIAEHLDPSLHAEIASNPEFLREGAAIYDAFNGDRIIIGTSSEKAAKLLAEVNAPFGIPVFTTDIRSAEMIKYAANAFLATKISFINEVANLCDLLGADVDDVAQGMGMDGRIGAQFLRAGHGYGGSCFPKDTKALVHLAATVDYDFALLQSVVDSNKKQKQIMVDKAKEVIGDLKGKRIALLGLAFKPNTDDMRESPAIDISRELLLSGAEVVAYDPIAKEQSKLFMPDGVHYVASTEEALAEMDAAIIVTDWEEFKDLPMSTFEQLMTQPLVFDGRNCYDLNTVAASNVEYYSVGRKPVVKTRVDARV